MSIKAILVDESLPVVNVVQVVCQRIGNLFVMQGLANPDEYSFKRDVIVDDKPKDKKKKVETDAGNNSI